MQNETPQVLGMENVEVPKPKDEPKDTKAEQKLLDEMMFSPTSSGADSTIELTSTTDEKDFKPSDKHNSKELLKMMESSKESDRKLSAKYQKQLLEKALKDPSSIEVNTKDRGWMTVKDAIDEGFNLVTGEFDQEPIPKPNFEEKLKELDPREQATIRRLTRTNRQAGPRPVMQPQSGEASLEEAGINPRPDVSNPEAPASDAGMAMGSAPEIPLGM